MQKLLDTLNVLWIDAGIKIIYVLIILIVGTRLIKLLIKMLKKGRVINKLDKSVSTFLISFINNRLTYKAFIG